MLQIIRLSGSCLNPRICSRPARKRKYGYYVLFANADVEVRCTTQRATGILSLFHHSTQKDADLAGNTARTSDIGVDEFDLWSPRRRPLGHNLALWLSTSIAPFSSRQVTNGVYRPTSTVNAWVADPADTNPAISLEWENSKTINHVVLDFDPDWDHTMESVMRWHPDRAMPFTVCDFQIENENGDILKKITGNYLARVEVNFPDAVTTRRLTLRVLSMNGSTPAAIFGVGVFG
jgi:hypothetical protein